MAVTWLDPGGSATGGTQFFSTVSGGVSAQTSDTNGQAYAYELTTSTGPTTAIARKSGILQAAGNRISAFIKAPALPNDNVGMRILGANPSGSNVQLLVVTLGSDGKLRLYSNATGTALGAAGSTVLSANTWYRVTLSYAITSTTNWSAKVYINGTLEMTRTNSDGTLSSAAPNEVSFVLNNTLSTNTLLRVADIYVDNTTDQTDPGNIHVTAKQPTTTTTNNFDTTVGSGAVNERPVSTTNGKQHAATGDVDQDYDLQTASAGDVDITGATLIESMGWIWAELSSLTGTPLSKIIVNGSRIGTSWDPAAANTAQLFTTIIGSGSAYPRHASNGKNIGTSSSTIAADTKLWDCGVVIAYIPSSSNNYTRDEAGDQPASTGALSRIYQALRSLAGSQPTATGVLTRLYQALRSLAGNQPAPTGTLDRLHATARSLAGDQPAPTGTLTASISRLRDEAGNQSSPTGTVSALKITARDVAGDQPTATGALSRILQALRSLAGDQPSPTGVLSRTIAVTRSLAGDQPSPTGALARILQALRSLAGDQPAPTGALTRIKQALRSLAGNQPSPTGTLSAQTLVGLRRAIVTWIELEAPFAVRTLTGNQPSPSGTLSRIRNRLISLAGNQPSPTGVLTRLPVKLRSLAGSQPSATGALARLKQALRSLAGSQPASTGTLARLQNVSRSLTGDQPAPSGELLIHGTFARSLTGDHPASTGALARLLATTRVLAGNDPAPTGSLATFKGVPNVRGRLTVGDRLYQRMAMSDALAGSVSASHVSVGGTITADDE